MAQTSYCNTTSDLVRAYPRIMEQFRERRTITGYKAYTTANVFMIGGTGYIEAMYEDDTKMTAAASIVTVDAAQEYYYDATNDTLRVFVLAGTQAAAAANLSTVTFDVIVAYR